MPKRSRVLRAVASRAREQAGFTMIEVLVAAVMLAVVMIPITNALVFEGKQVPIATNYAQAIGNQTAGLQRMMQEVRQAYAIESTNGDPTTGKGTYVDFLIMIFNASSGVDQPWEVRYDCGQVSPNNAPHGTAYNACIRYACLATAYDAACALPTSNNAVVDRLVPGSGPAFAFRDKTGNPATNAQDIWTVEATVQVPSRGSSTSCAHWGSTGCSTYYGLTHSVQLDNQTNLPNLQNGT